MTEEEREVIAERLRAVRPLPEYEWDCGCGGRHRTRAEAVACKARRSVGDDRG